MTAYRTIRCIDKDGRETVDRFNDQLDDKIWKEIAFHLPAGAKLISAQWEEWPDE